MRSDKMYERMNVLKKPDFEKLHEYALKIFNEVGVVFHSSKARKIFKTHGIKIDNNIVYFQAKDLEKALETAPSRFTIHARNPQKSVNIGGNDLVIAPGYGSPFIITRREQRRAVFEDYINFCKLVHTSKYIDMTGMLMGDPYDLPADKAHLNMIFSNIINCDKPFIGSSISQKAALDSINMAGIVWDGKKKILKTSL